MIEVKNLAFSFGAQEVLRNINLRLEPGKIYGLLGENGVGKTTLLTLLCGLKKTRSGEISTDGLDPYRRDPEFLGNQYYLPDEVAPLRMKASEWAASQGKFYPLFDREKFSELMKLFETSEDARMNTMSNGQLKKTYISFALACNTAYLFLDEPTNGLDIPSKSQLRSAILKYTREDATIVISTHQVRDLENIIDPIIILDKRDVLLNASIEEISSKLFFDYSRELKSDTLYSEQLPAGFIQVYPNASGEDSKVNVEALFNAVHSNKETVKALFSNE